MLTVAVVQSLSYVHICVGLVNISLARLVAQPCPTLCDPIGFVPHVPLSMGFSKQKHWSGLPFPSQGIFPIQGLNSGLLHCKQILHRLSHQDRSTLRNILMTLKTEGVNNLVLIMIFLNEVSKLLVVHF